MKEGNKLIIGIISSISNILADAKINILDINQTILQGFFTMAMVVDMSQSTLDIYSLREKLKAKGQELGLEITAQHEDIFRFMHRI